MLLAKTKILSYYSFRLIEKWLSYNFFKKCVAEMHQNYFWSRRMPLRKMKWVHWMPLVETNILSYCVFKLVEKWLRYREKGV